MDNDPGHSQMRELSEEGVEIEFLPANTTSLLVQPLHKGIILAFKANYTKPSMR